MSARPLRRPLLAQSDARSRGSETIYSQKGIPAAMRTFACLLQDYSHGELSNRGRKTKPYLYTFTVTFVLKMLRSPVFVLFRSFVSSGLFWWIRKGAPGPMVIGLLSLSFLYFVWQLQPSLFLLSLPSRVSVVI